MRRFCHLAGRGSHGSPKDRRNKESFFFKGVFFLINNGNINDLNDCSGVKKVEMISTVALIVVI